jgi:hypothetical protein
MNEEYLWAKKGNDPEIEMLEGLLSEFRFQPGELHEFGSDTATKREGFFNKPFAWIFGLATPTFAAALIGIWLFTSSPAGDLRVRVSEEVVPAADGTSTIAIADPLSISIVKEKTKPQSARKRFVPTKVKTVYRSRKSKADRSESLVAVRLTKEEQYAYDQLKLALSIAGTKLKIVQDTVDGKGSIRNAK